MDHCIHFSGGRCVHDWVCAREWSFHFATAEIICLLQAAFSWLYVCTHGLAQGRNGDVRSGNAALPHQGKENYMQIGNNWWTFFSPGTSRTVELCRCPDSKCPLDCAFGWCFVVGVLFPKRRAPFVRRGEVMSVVEFRLPQDDSLNFWRAIYYLLWMKLRCMLSFFCVWK